MDFKISFEKPLTCSSSGCVGQQKQVSTLAVFSSSNFHLCTTLHKWIIQSQKEGRERRREKKSRAVFWNAVPPPHTWYGRFHLPSQVDLDIRVYMPSGLVTEAFGVLDPAAFRRGFRMWNLLVPSWCLRHAHVFSNFWYQVEPARHVTIKSWLSWVHHTQLLSLLGFSDFCLCF